MPNEIQTSPAPCYTLSELHQLGRDYMADTCADFLQVLTVRESLLRQSSERERDIDPDEYHKTLQAQQEREQELKDGF